MFSNLKCATTPQKLVLRELATASSSSNRPSPPPTGRRGQRHRPSDRLGSALPSSRLLFWVSVNTGLGLLPHLSTRSFRFHGYSAPVPSSKCKPGGGAEDELEINGSRPSRALLPNCFIFGFLFLLSSRGESRRFFCPLKGLRSPSGVFRSVSQRSKTNKFVKGREENVNYSD